MAPVWTDRDTALWHTCEMLCDLAGGKAPTPVAGTVTAFPPSIAVHETMLAAGPFSLSDFRPLGEGTYFRDMSFFWASGAGGLATTAAFAAARPAGNAQRRDDAIAETVPRWLYLDHGWIFVSTAGFYLQTSHGLLTWPWGAVTAAPMLAPGVMHLLGESQRGPVAWALRSDWAELVFVSWAFARHPDHPQLAGGQWIPPGWLGWAAAQQRHTQDGLLAR
jgi:hypothetical protein